MWRRVDIVWTDVSEEHIASIFRVEKSAIEELAWAGGCRLSHQSMLTLVPRSRIFSPSFPIVCTPQYVERKYVFTYVYMCIYVYVTDSMERSHSWEANSRSDGEESPHRLCNSKVHYCVLKVSHLILSWIIVIQPTTSHPVSLTSVLITLSPTPRPFKWYSRFGVSD
jgi:hypothetical protein